MQLSLVPAYHELLTGRFLPVHRHLSAKLITSFLISTNVLCSSAL